MAFYGTLFNLKYTIFAKFFLMFMKISNEIKAGLIAIFAIVGFVLLFQFMKERSLFSTTNVYYTIFDNVQGLNSSSPVSINGLKVGKVEKISPIIAKDGAVTFLVQVRIDDKFSFSKKSTLEIFESGLMSDTAIRLRMENGNPLAKDGDTLQAGYELSLMKSLAAEAMPIKQQVEGVLKQVDSLTTNANKLLNEQNQQEIRALLINLNRTVSAFEQTSRQTNTLLAKADPKLQTVLDNTSAMTVSAKNTLDKYGKVADNIDVQKLNTAVANLSETAHQLNGLIAGIQKGEGSLGKIMKDEAFYNNLTQTSDNLNKLIEDLKNNPKKYINISVFGKK